MRIHQVAADTPAPGFGFSWTGGVEGGDNEGCKEWGRTDPMINLRKIPTQWGRMPRQPRRRADGSREDAGIPD